MIHAKKQNAYGLSNDQDKVSLLSPTAYHKGSGEKRKTRRS